MTAQRIVFIRHGKPLIDESVPSAQWHAGIDSCSSGAR
jgi:hypothetical protein